MPIVITRLFGLFLFYATIAIVKFHEVIVCSFTASHGWLHRLGSRFSFAPLVFWSCASVLDHFLGLVFVDVLYGIGTVYLLILFRLSKILLAHFVKVVIAISCIVGRVRPRRVVCLLIGVIIVYAYLDMLKAVSSGLFTLLNQRRPLLRLLANKSFHFIYGLL